MKLLRCFSCLFIKEITPIESFNDRITNNLPTIAKYHIKKTVHLSSHLFNLLMDHLKFLRSIYL